MAKIIECPKCGTKVESSAIDQRHCWVCRTRLVVRDDKSGRSTSEFNQYVEQKNAAGQSIAAGRKSSGNWFVNLVKLIIFISLGVLAYIFVPGFLADNDIDREKVSEYTQEISKDAQDIYDSKVAKPLEKMLTDRGVSQ